MCICMYLSKEASQELVGSPEVVVGAWGLNGFSARAAATLNHGAISLALVIFFSDLHIF